MDGVKYVLLSAAVGGAVFVFMPVVMAGEPSLLVCGTLSRCGGFAMVGALGGALLGALAHA